MMTARLVGMALLLAAAESKDLLPETGEIKDWQKVGHVREFTPDTLWRFIDGDAERYLRVGFERALTADYRYEARTDAALSIFVLKTPEGARQIYDSESDGGSRSEDIGDAARLWPDSAVFRRGRYLVRIVAYEDAPDAVAALARGVDRKLRQQ